MDGRGRNHDVRTLSYSSSDGCCEARRSVMIIFCEIVAVCLVYRLVYLS